MNSQKALHLLIPTPMQVAGCVVGALAVLLVAYWSIIIQVLANGFGVNQATLAASLTRQVSILDALPYADRIPGIIFWFIVLMTVYTGYLRIHNALVELYDDFVVATEFTGQPSWGAHLWQIVPRVALYLGFLLLIALSWKVLGPLWLLCTSQYVWTLFSVQYLPLFVAGLVGIIVNLYAVVVVVQLMMYE